MVKIGLEIHGYIDTKEKLFCTCKAIHGAKFTAPNVNVCPICTGQPGAKPMLPNKEAIKKAIQISLILGCKINQKTEWQRKHYSWPDLPKGYQNTLSGPYAIPTGINGKFMGVRIKECHLEEDPAAWNPKTGEIDYNRSGIPLIEIVTEPEFKDAEEVEKWLRELITTLGYVKAIDKSSGIKADINVSVNGERVEIKNVNSIIDIKEAIIVEIARQEKNPVNEQETRRYDAEKKITIKMRQKEQAQDYRFISDPDLPLINLQGSFIRSLKNKIPETPMQKLHRLIKQYKIPRYSAEILIRNIDVIELFEKTIREINSKLAVRWITEELFSVLNYNKKTLDEIDLNPEHFIELLKLIEKKELSEPKARDILRSWKERSSPPSSNINEYRQISDLEEIERIVDLVIKENKKAVEDYKSGKNWAINFLMGKIMEKTNKRANYTLARDLLIKKLR